MQQLLRSARSNNAAGMIVKPVEGSSLAKADGLPDEAHDAFSKLVSLFPVCMSVAFSATKITVPTGFNPGAVTKSGAFGLASFDPGELFGQSVVMFGFYFDALSCDPDAIAPNVAWGTEQGLGAALVVGMDMGLTENAWSVATCPVAGVETGSVLLVRGDVGHKLFSRSFPPGKLSSGWNKRAMNGGTVPFVQRCNRGRKVQAGLFIRGTQIANTSGADKFWNGFIDGELYFGMTRHPEELTK